MRIKGPAFRSLAPSLVILFLTVAASPHLNSKANAARIDVKDHGAIGDGIADDRAAIQAVIDLVASSNGSDTVYLSPGTYLLRTLAEGRPNDDDNASTAILWLPSQVTVEGDGAQSILKVGPGLNDYDPMGTPRTGGFSLFVGLREVLAQNVALKNFRIDGNAQNNPLPPDADPRTPGWQWPTGFNPMGHFLRIHDGRGITVDDCSFVNSNSRQIISFGAGPNDDVVEDITLTDNLFSGHPMDALQDDHSSIFSIASTTGLSPNIIARNTFVSLGFDFGSQYSTALEIHGSNNLVEDNIVDGYRLGANYIAGLVDNVGTVFRNNQFSGVSAGFNLWSIPPFEIRNGAIQDNTVVKGTIRKGDHHVDWNKVFSPVIGLVIERNIFATSALGVDPVARNGIGVAINGYAKQITIRDNTIIDSECQGIRIGGPNAVPFDLLKVVDPVADSQTGVSTIEDILIEGNQILNPGSWGAQTNACSVGLSILIPGSLPGYDAERITVTDSASGPNRITYSSAHPLANQGMETAIRLLGPIVDSDFLSVQVTGKIDRDYSTVAAHLWTDVVIDHHDVDDSTSPSALGVDACPGSRWENKDGLVWNVNAGSLCNNPTWTLM